MKKLLMLQISSFSVTPLGQEKSVTVIKCHSNRIVFDVWEANWELSKLSLLVGKYVPIKMNQESEYDTSIICNIKWVSQTPSPSLIFPVQKIASIRVDMTATATLPCQQQFFGPYLYRVTHLVDSNLLLTSKQKFRIGLACTDLAGPKRNFCFDVNRRFESTRCVTLY